MARRMERLGVALRPHFKTAKSAEVARRALDRGAVGLTVSTLREAEYCLEHGFRDLTYAVGIVPARLERVARLLRAGAVLRLLTDEVEVAREIADRGDRLGVGFDVLVEIDVGGGRGGLPPEDPRLPEIARELRGGARLAGVLTHAGQAYDCEGPDEVRAVAESERAGIVRAAERLREAGFACPIVSAGSTPTAALAERLDGITEMRPGNYVFFDLFQEALGVCSRDDLALSVIASVIGYSASGGPLVDAGALALSADASAAGRRPGTGFGVVLDEGGTPLGDLHVARLHQEHGFVEGSGPDLPVGARVRILPGHACITAAMFDHYHAVDPDGSPRGTWPRVRGW